MQIHTRLAVTNEIFSEIHVGIHLNLCKTCLENLGQYFTDKKDIWKYKVSQSIGNLDV